MSHYAYDAKCIVRRSSGNYLNSLEKNTKTKNNISVLRTYFYRFQWKLFIIRMKNWASQLSKDFFLVQQKTFVCLILPHNLYTMSDFEFPFFYNFLVFWYLNLCLPLFSSNLWFICVISIFPSFRSYNMRMILQV